MANPERGDWQCPNQECFNHNYPSAFVFGSKVNCPKCGTGQHAQRAGDWCCPNTNCVNHRNTVYGSKAACDRCGCPRPDRNAPGRGAQLPVSMTMGVGLTSAVAGARPGDWHCPNIGCKNHTANFVYGGKSTCPLCGMAKPPIPTAPLPPALAAVMPMQHQKQPHMWGGHMGYVQPQDYARHLSTTMPHKVGEAANKQSFPRRPGDWHCTNATCKNHKENVVYAGKTHCPICATPKGNAQIVPRRPGDWNCPNIACQNHTGNCVVYASKTHCPLCGTENRFAQGGGAGGASGPGARERSRSARRPRGP